MDVTRIGFVGVAFVLMACADGPPREALPPDAEPDPIVMPSPDEEEPPEPAEWDTPAARAIWTEARERGVDFRAIGQEPGWTLEIWEGDRIELLGDYGDWRIVTPAPPPETPGPPGRTYYRIRTDAHTLDITIEPVDCFDTMSGEPFPAAVRVILDGRTFEGCGRALR